MCKCRRARIKGPAGRIWTAGRSLPMSGVNHVLCMVYKFALKARLGVDQGWKLKPKPKPENPVLKEILETQTETDTYLAKFLKT